LRLLERHYPFFLAHTDSCAKPLPSFRFQVTPLFERSLQVAASPCCVKALPNAIAVVLPYVPGPLLQLLPRCCLPFLPLGHWPSPSEHGSALGFAPPLLLRMVKILELQSFHYVPAHRFVRLIGSSYPHTHSCVSGSHAANPQLHSGADHAPTDVVRSGLDGAGKGQPTRT
jgi:hypothetical protein